MLLRHLRALGSALFVLAALVAAAAPAKAAASPILDWTLLVRDAQAAQAAGRLKEAADLFGRARKLVPENLAPLRGACDVALDLQRAGQLASSREPCHRAFLFGAQPEDMYREVASLMREPTAPSLDTTVLAAFAADAAVHRAGGEPWGYLARCEIARRLGLADVLEGCLADLKRIAPEAPQTKAMFEDARPRPSAWIWTLRLLLVLAPLVTAAHAIRQRVRARPRRVAAANVVASLSVLAVACGLAAPARAALVERDGHPVLEHDQLSVFPIDDANPEATIPSIEQQNAKPLQFGYYLQDLAAKVERAEKNHDTAAVIRYYRAIAKAAPRSPYGPRKLCEALESAGDLDGAIAACRDATLIEGTTVGDFRRLADVIQAKPGKLTPALRNEVYGAIDHIQNEAQLGALPDVLRCKAALRFQDWPMLRDCSARLGRNAPNDPQSVSFQWALAVHDRDTKRAGALVDRARTLRMDPAGVQKMEATTRAMGRIGLVHLLFAGAVLALLAGAWRLGAKKLLTRRNASA